MRQDGRVSVYALWGSRDTPEARTAARAGATEMAVNARIDDKSLYSGTDFSNVLSQASYISEVSRDDFFTRRAALDFVLPRSYLEVTRNAHLLRRGLLVGRRGLPRAGEPRCVVP